MDALKPIAGIAATLMVNELLPRLKRKGLDITSSPVSAEVMADLSIRKFGGMSTHEIRRCLDELVS